MIASPKTVLFHIGLERTGTTSFQRYCVRNARHLLKQGVLYPTKSAAFLHANHAPLAASYLPGDRPVDFYLRGAGASHEALLAGLKAEIDASAAHTVLLSSEHLSSRFGASQVEALAGDFRDYRCGIVVTLREHFACLVSSYAVHVLSGSEQTLDDYAAMVLQPANSYLRFARMLAPWEAAFGRDTVAALSYAENPDIVAHLLDRLGLARFGATARDAYRANASLDLTATKALRLINVAIQTERGRSDGYAEFRRQEYVRSLVWRRLRNVSHPRGTWHLRTDHRTGLLAIAEGDRRFLADVYGLDLGPMDLPTSATEEAFGATSDLLAETLMQAVCERWAPRAVMTSRSVAHSALDRMRRITAR